MLKKIIRKVIQEMSNEKSCEIECSRSYENQIEDLTGRLSALENHLGIKTVPVYRKWEVKEFGGENVLSGMAKKHE